MTQSPGGDGLEQIRDAVLDLLLDKVSQDRFPSSTVMDKIEAMLTPDHVAAYAAVLLSKIKDDQFPSISMINRLVNLTG